MAWKISALVGLTAFAVACGQSTDHGVDRGDGVGGTAGPSGGASGTGGSGASGGSMLSPICPEAAPEAGSACDSNLTNCRYDVCGDDTVEMFSCRGSQWRLTRACGPLTCPADRPLFLSDCAPLEGIECGYEENCCDTTRSTQSVVARCELAQWTFVGRPENSCSFCKVNHENGTPCDLPSECASSGCFSISCYSQPAVEECVDGVWRVQTTCIK